MSAPPQEPMPASYSSYEEYWTAYLRAHSRPATRACHYLATCVGLGLVVAAVATGAWWWLPIGVAAGYAIAIGSHFAFQGNRPLVHRPLWGAASDLRMFGLALRGRLRAEIERRGAGPGGRAT